MTMSAKDCAAKAAEMENRADLCFSDDAANVYRELASEWRYLTTERKAKDTPATTPG